MKNCKVCKLDKPFLEFYFRKDCNNYRNWCKECEKIRVLAHYNANVDRYSEAFKLKYAANPEKYRKLSRNAYWANPAKNIAASKEYGIKNKARLRPLKTSYENKRRATKLNATPKWLTREQLLTMTAIYQLAKLAERLTGKKYHVDHIMPLKGKLSTGLHVPWNLQILEAKTNISKGNRVAEVSK